MKVLKSILVSLAACAGLLGQDFVVDNGVEPQSLDPAKVSGLPEFRILGALFEGLMVTNARTGKAEPGLAEHWSASADGRTYTFRLRQAEWSDGTPITAQTVVDSWFRTMDPKTAAPYAQMLSESLEGAKAYCEGKGPKEGVGLRAVDPQTVEATFVGPMPYILDMLPHAAWAVVPMHVIQKYGDDWIRPGHVVSDGPFVLQDWTPKDRIQVVKNPHYWDAAGVKLASITFLPVESQAAGYDMFKAGQVDFMPDVDPQRIDEIKVRKDYQLSAGSGVMYYCFNMTRKPFDDVHVRKALSLAADRKVLVEQVLKGGQSPSGGLVPAFGSFRTTRGNPFNPGEARRLLAAAGFPGGQGFPAFEAVIVDEARDRMIGEWLRQQWEENLGLHMTLKRLEWSSFLDTCYKTHDYAVNGIIWVADFPDPMNFLGELLKTGSGNNSGLYSNPKVDALLAKANRMPGGAARDKVLMGAEAMAITQDQALLPLFFTASQNLIDLGKWGGWYPNPMDVHPWKAIYRK